MMKEEKNEKGPKLAPYFFFQNIRPTIIYLFQFWSSHFQFVTNNKSNFFF